MKSKALVLIMLIAIMIYINVIVISIDSTQTAHQAELDNLKDTVRQINIPASIEPIEINIKTLTKEIKAIKSEIKAIKKTSRGETDDRRIMRATAYDLSYESCGKYPSHPEYGITASGATVREWYTIAAGPELPFGTKVYIPYFRDKPNKGIFVVQDRGGGIRKGCIDIYMSSGADCRKFGVRKLEVFVLGKEVYK